MGLAEEHPRGEGRSARSETCREGEAGGPQVRGRGTERDQGGLAGEGRRLGRGHPQPRLSGPGGLSARPPQTFCACAARVAGHPRPRALSGFCPRPHDSGPTSARGRGAVGPWRQRVTLCPAGVTPGSLHAWASSPGETPAPELPIAEARSCSPHARSEDRWPLALYWVFPADLWGLQLPSEGPWTLPKRPESSRKFREGEGRLQAVHRAESVRQRLREGVAGGGSQLVAGTALQGLPQGLRHAVHVLPGGVAAQEADPQHLGQGRAGVGLGAEPGPPGSPQSRRAASRGRARALRRPLGGGAGAPLVLAPSGPRGAGPALTFPTEGPRPPVISMEKWSMT